MKGVIFTELVEMIEKEFGLEVLDQVIEEAKLESNGIYTTVGNYPDSELHSILSVLGKITGLSSQEMLMGFSNCFFHMLSKQYLEFFEAHNSSLDFLSSLDDYIHPEALKLYPGAVAPGFKPKRIDENTLELIYSSKRKLPVLARGLIKQTALHYNEDLDIKEEMVEEDGSIVKFTLTRG
jgi:hypothetical protein